MSILEKSVAIDNDYIFHMGMFMMDTFFCCVWTLFNSFSLPL